MADAENKPEILDLDTLVPQSTVVKWGGTEYNVKPPRTGDVLKLGAIGKKLEKPEELTDEQTITLVADLTAQIIVCIPEMADKQFTMAQLMALMQLITKMSVPKDAAELAAAGITPKDPKAAA